jgi:hypothetical protein
LLSLVALLLERPLRRRTRWRTALILLPLAALLAGPPLLLDLAGETYHVDEYVWLHSSYYYRLFFMERKLDSAEWQTNEGRHRPPIAKYTMGLGLQLSGCGLEPDARKLKAWWRLNCHMPAENPGIEPELLLSARRTCALLGLGAALLIFLIGCRLAGPLAGLAACAVFAYNPLVLMLCRRAMAESTLLFFVCGAVLAQVWFFGDPASPLRRPLRTAAFVLLESLCLSCAVGTKLNGALAALAFVAAMILLSVAVLVLDLRREGAEPRRWPWRLAAALTPLGIAAIVGAGAFGILVLLNPFLHAAPLERVEEVRAAATEELAKSIKLCPQDALETTRARAGFVFGSLARGRGLSFPYLLGDWGQILLLAAGFLLLSGRALWNAFRRRPTADLPVWCWVLGCFLGVILWVPADWDRFLAPVLPCACVLIGLALGEILGAVFRTATSTRTAGDSQP